LTPSNSAPASTKHSIKLGPRNKVLALPPDFTRFHSLAGPLTRFVYDYYGDRLTDILPAIGTHTPMTPSQLDEMFPGVPHSLFRVHDWRHGITTLGEVPGAYLSEVSEGMVDYPWPAQVANLIAEGGFDLILSLGQVVPHEVIGMANYNKNVFVGTGGVEGINKSHFLGAVYGMERIMGRADTPVRRVLNYASDHFATHLPIVYVQTVVGAGDARRPRRPRPLHRRRRRVLRARLRTQPRGQLPHDGPRDPQGRRLPRPRRVQVHLARQQERLSHPHGHRRRRRTDRPRARREGVRRGPAIDA
jgi:hypothetical protein